MKKKSLLLLALTLTITSLSADAHSQPSSPTPPGAAVRPAAGGVMVGWHEEGQDLDRLASQEAALGKRFALVRLYHQWRLPGHLLDRVVGEGRLPLSSHKPPDPARGGWRAVASGSEDGMIRALARKYRSLRAEAVFIFHHEPHDDASDHRRGGKYGTPEEFRAAFRRLHRIFVEEGAHVSAGGNVLFGYSGTWTWITAGDPPGSADALYPGDDVVDVLAHDRYNWASCRRERWKTFPEIWAPVVALAAAHGKPLIAAEFGSAPASGRRNPWFDEAARWLKTDPLAQRHFVGLAYFHNYMDDCHWDFMNQGNDGREGWRRSFSADPYFLDRPVSVASWSAPRPAPPPVPAPRPASPPAPAPRPASPPAPAARPPPPARRAMWRFHSITGRTFNNL